MAKYTGAEITSMGMKGQAFKNGDNSYSYPIGDAEDLDNAIHAVGRGNADHDAIRKYIIGRAKALGKSSAIPDNWNADGSLSDGGSDGSSSRSFDTPFVRSFALEDVSIRAGAGSDGRTVEAYAAIFDMPAEIHDPDGDYIEIIDPSCFNRAIEHARRRNGGWNTPVMFNHGMTMYHTPSEAGSMPIGITEEIRADSRGLFTRARYNRTPLADAALENIREGSITSYSFQGAFKRSSPGRPRGGYRAGRNGELPTVRRTESTLREYGPTPFPAYQGAEVVGVRAEHVAMMLGSLSPGERDRLAGLFASSTRHDPLDDGTPDMGPADQDPPMRHSARSIREQVQANSARLIIRREI